METTELCTQRGAQELLAEFKATGRQEPFEEIVRRYAGMVYHVCLQVTKNSHDAEDATQAVFLTLAVQAKTSKEIRCLGPWLQQVGHRLSLDLRKSKKRRQAREEKHGLIQQHTHSFYEQPAPLDQEELRVIINEELNRLPAKYRLPLILYYFGGLSRDAMAKELHLKLGTLGARLHRGRAMLGTRLADRGVILAEGSLAGAIVFSVQTTITDALIANTCQAATQYVACGELNIGVLPIQVVGLVKNAVRAAIYTKLKTLGVLLLVAGTAVAAGAEVVSRARPLELRFNVPSELGDRILPLLQPIPIPKFSDATPKVPDRPTISPVVVQPDTALADRTGGGLRWEGGVGASGLSGWGGVGQGWPGASSSGGVSYLSSGSGVGAKYSATVLAGAMPQVSYPSLAGRVGTAGSLSSNSLAPQALSGMAPVRPVVPLGSGVAMAGSQGRVVRLGDGLANTQTNVVEAFTGEPSVLERPGASGFGSNMGGPIGPPLAHNPTSVEPPGTPSGPPPTSPPPQIAVAPPPAPPVIGSGTGLHVVVYPTNLGQIVSSSTGSVPPGGVGPVAMNGNGGSDTSAPAIVNNGSHSPLGLDTIGYESLFSSDSRGAGLDGSVSAVVQAYVPLEQGRFISTSDTLQGYGKAVGVETFNHNGRVIADGYGSPQTLDLSQVSAIENSIDNPAYRGTNGWFAKNRGKLTLPPLDVTPGTGTYTWGERDDDSTIDLVNSVRMRMADVANESLVTISLLSLDRAGSDGVPALPAGHTFVGLWELDAPGLVAGGIDLTIRYDDGLVRDLNLNEMSIKMWRYEDGNWEIIQRTPQNLASHVIMGHTDSLSFFAVSSPEPSGMLIFATSVLFLTRRRRQQ